MLKVGDRDIIDIGCVKPRLRRAGVVVARLVSVAFNVRRRYDRRNEHRNRLTKDELCGRNSAVECQLPKLDVAGSNPVARFFQNPLL